MYDAPQGFVGNSRLEGVKMKIRRKLIYIYVYVCDVVCMYDAPQGFVGNSRLKGVKMKIRQKLYIWMCVCRCLYVRSPAGIRW